MSYIIYALPRSRTFWLSKFLTYGDWICDHDAGLFLRGLEDVESWRRLPCRGSVETALAPFWRLAKGMLTVTLRRPVDDVIESFRGTGLAFDFDMLVRKMRLLDAKLNQIECRVPNVFSLTYDELAREDACATLFEHLLPYKHDTDWWQSMSGLNLQVDLRHQMAYYQAHEPQLTKLEKIAKHQIIAGMRPQVKAFEDGTVVGEDKLSNLADAMKMAADHAVVVGEPPDSWKTKNWDLLFQLEDMGCLQVVSGRCNGRVFGYLVSILTPSLEAPSLMTAVQTLFYADPAFRGLGMKLQRESIKLLKERGVGEVYFHAGIRGSGPRLGTLYKRLGASDFGQLFKLA